MATNPIHWIEIPVTDMQRAQTFYETILSAKLSEMPPPPGCDGMQMVGLPMTQGAPGAGGALVKNKGFTPGAVGPLVYITCDDLDDAISKVVPSGGTVNLEKMSIGEHGYIAIILDTEGNHVGLHGMPE